MDRITDLPESVNNNALWEARVRLIAQPCTPAHLGQTPHLVRELRKRKRVGNELGCGGHQKGFSGVSGIPPLFRAVNMTGSWSRSLVGTQISSRMSDTAAVDPGSSESA
jgi:hypothetical protein